MGTKLSSNTASIRGYPGPEVGTLLCDGSCDSAPFHLPLVVHYHAGVVFKVYEHTILPPKRFSLPNHHCRHYLKYNNSCKWLFNRKLDSTLLLNYWNWKTSYPLHPKKNCLIIMGGYVNSSLCFMTIYLVDWKISYR